MELYKNYIFITVIYTVVTLPNVCGEIGVNCGSGAGIGQPYNLQCTNIPDNVTIGINVFLGDVSNSIIPCFLSKKCAPRDISLYSVVSPHNESLYFTILSVTKDDIGKKLYCVDNTTLDLSSPKPSCTIIGGDVLTSCEITGIVVACFFIVVVIVCFVIFIMWNKKCCCFRKIL